MAIPHRIKMVELSRVAPPQGSVAASSLPLTFFDVIWLQAPPVQHLFFYEFSNPKTDTTRFLNSLKRSLSRALHLFYPLAGTLTLSPKTGEYEIRYDEGDSVQIIVAESDSDFHGLVEDIPKDVRLFHPLVPELPTSDSHTDLLSLQVTVFPNSGICIAISVHHAAADGSSTMHFVKYWASISRLGHQHEHEPSFHSVPIYDRTLIRDDDGLKEIFLDQMARYKSEESSRVRARADTVLATFVLSRDRIERLRQRVIMAYRVANGEKPSHYPPPFALTCAHVWVCWVKARRDSKEKTVHFNFDSGCRARLEPPIPVTYFGNCLRPCFVDAIGGELAREEDGIWVACEAIWRVIQRLDHGVLKGVEGWISRFMSIASAGERVLSVAWSPKIGVYDTDFGLGRPRKVEVISIEETGGMSLTESRDGGEGGLEVGLVLPKCQMEYFASLFEEGLTDI